MIHGNGSLSLRKKDLENQKNIAVGFQKTVWAHKAVAGDNTINLTSLTVPTEMTANGFTNPPTSQLNAAQLLFYKNNLTLVSSLRGTLQRDLSYKVSSSSVITFLDFTAESGEIFVGTIDYTAATGVKVVDASPITASGILAINTTDFNTGTPFTVGKYSSIAQIGAVLVFLDGVLQMRNSGNSSVVLDGTYYEVDAGAGLGTLIRFNTADPINPHDVLVISNGLLSERPDGSMMAVIEAVQGQVNNMATYVAAATGNTTTTVLGAAPSNVDLKNFGDRVQTLEQNRARIDQSNTWTAYQHIPGRTDGVAVPAGYVGETLTFDSGTLTTATTGNPAFIPYSFSLGAGIWELSSAAQIVDNNTGGITTLAVNTEGGSALSLGAGQLTQAAAASGQFYVHSQPVTRNLSTLTTINIYCYIVGTFQNGTDNLRVTARAVRIA